MSKLGEKIPLDTPQLRVYLSCMEKTANRKASQGSPNPNDGLIYANYCEAEGIRMATRQLLRALNLPEDWAERMDRLEEAEVRRGLTSSERSV